MTLIDVLPSEGDLGITDNVERGSMFTPLLTGPVILPAEWENKVDIVYSTVKNPKRDDLTRYTVYPGTTTKLSNPGGAEDPNWMTTSEITDWSTIHSFKLQLKDGIEWIKGQDILIEFSMVAPEANEVNRDIIDRTIEPTERAAWNSFAVATDHGQPVEPFRVGVYMDYDIEEPEVEKSVNEQKDPYELIDRDEEFTWEVRYDFGDHTADWKTVSFSEEIDMLLEIIEVIIINKNNENIADYRDLITDHHANLVTFNISKQNDSSAFLKNQTSTMSIKTKIRDDL